MMKSPGDCDRQPVAGGGRRASSVAGANDDYENEDNSHNSQC